MKIFLLILLSICTIIKAEPPRYKYRVPPAQYHYRMPQNKQFAKKWAQPPRGVPTPVRNRLQSTIPVHMPFAHKIPMGIQGFPSRPVSPPVRAFWKNTQNNVKFPLIEKTHQLPQLLKKQPFVSAPSLPIPEYDYHIQTNSIPNGPVNTIKQVGEKGPIHTIPAPNLSLKDKPIGLNDVRKEVSILQSSAYLDPVHHHYQVTEPPEAGQIKLLRAQQLKLQQLQQQQFQQHQLHQQQMYQQQQQFQQKQMQQQLQQQKNHEQFEQQLQQQKNQEQFEQQLQQQKNHEQFEQQLQQQKNQELFEQQLQQQKNQEQFEEQQKLHQYQQLINQQIKQQKPDNYFQQPQATNEVQVQPQQVYLAGETSEIQPNSLQQGHISEDLLVNNQLTSQELYQLLGNSYPQNIEHQGSVQTVKAHSDSDFQGDNLYQINQDFDLNAESSINSNPSTINFKPEFQSFNYDEQAHQASQKDLMKKKYSSLVTATYTLSPGHLFERHGQVESDNDPHSNFESRSDSEVSSAERKDKQEDSSGEKINEKMLDTSYYSSLPSKEAADRLADLQEAGKINHKLMELSKSKDDMAIFISTDNEDSMEEKDNSNSENSENHKDFDEDEDDSEATAEQDSKEFGNRIRPKTNN